MTEEEFEAVKARMRRSVESDRVRDAAMRRLGAPADWRSRVDEDIARAATAPAPATDPWGYGAVTRSGEVSFAQRAERVEAARLEHAARQRRAERETGQRERLFRTLRDRYGLDEAERAMREDW